MRCGTRLERVVCRLDQVLGFIPTIAAAAVLLNWSTGRLQVMTFDTLPGGVDAFNNEAIILIHPLWDTDAANFRPEVAAAVADAQGQGFRVTLRSVFHVVRFPYE